MKWCVSSKLQRQYRHIVIVCTSSSSTSLFTLSFPLVEIQCLAIQSWVSFSMQTMTDSQQLAQLNRTQQKAWHKHTRPCHSLHSYLNTDYTCEFIGFQLSLCAHLWGITCVSGSILQRTSSSFFLPCMIYILCTSHLSSVSINSIIVKWGFDRAKKLHGRDFLMWLSFRLLLE